MFKTIAGLTFAIAMTLGLFLSPATAEENAQETQTPAVEAAPPAEEASQEATASDEAEAEEPQKAATDE